MFLKTATQSSSPLRHFSVSLFGFNSEMFLVVSVSRWTGETLEILYSISLLIMLPGEGLLPLEDSGDGIFASSQVMSASW